METVVFLDRSAIPARITLRAPAFEHEWLSYETTLPEEVEARAADATILLTSKVQLSGETLARLPRLRLIASTATGTDPIDLAWCHAHDVTVCNVRNYSQETVPEHTFALMLAGMRQVARYRDDVRSGIWQQRGTFCLFDHPIHDLAGCRLGIIGDGQLGRRVGEIGRAFGMDVVFAAHKGSTGMGPLYTPWDEMMATSDVITLHCPLTPATRGMLDLAEFRKAKRSPLLVNTARGGLVVEEDVEIALDEGLLRGVALDVCSAEPPPTEGATMRLVARPEVIVTPHVAWASDRAMQRLADQVIDNIEAFVAARPQNVVRGAF